MEHLGAQAMKRIAVRWNEGETDIDDKSSPDANSKGLQALRGYVSLIGPFGSAALPESRGAGMINRSAPDWPAARNGVSRTIQK